MTEESAKKTILLVEDDQTLRELYAMALLKAGFHIIMAENGEQGVRLALAQHPDLVMLDLDMPVMNGHKAAENIRADSWGRTARIIFLTNHSDPQSVAHAVMQKPEDYIIKVNTPIHEIVNQVRIAMHGESRAL